MGNLLATKCECPKMTCDGLRDTPLRLIGYATHLGSICSKLISPNLSSVPDMLTTAYITSDVFNKATESSNEFKPRSRVAIESFDAIIWQMLATVLIPGYIINQIKNITLKATQPNTTMPCKPPPPLAKALPKPILKALPCIVGVLAIPLIRYPVDFAVTTLMDFTYRAIFSEEKKEPKKIEAKKKEPEKKVAEKKVAEKKKVEKKEPAKTEKPSK